MPRHSVALALAFLAATSGAVSGQLAVGDFLNPGDGYLVTDRATGIEWLTPYYTRGHAYNDAYVQSIIAGHGFRYATGDEVWSMMTANFGEQTTTQPGDEAGYAAAGAFFDVFGINAHVSCHTSTEIVPCPRTQGLSSTPGSTGRHLGFGAIQYGTTGWFIHDNDWPDTYADTQMGSWLVRPSAEGPVSGVAPEPVSMLLLGTGLAGVGAVRRRRRSETA